MIQKTLSNIVVTAKKTPSVEKADSLSSARHATRCTISINIYIFDEYLRWQVQKSICYPIDTALAHLLGYFLSKGDEANRVPVVCRNLNYYEEKNQSFDFCCNCDNDCDDDREDVNDRGDYSVLFTHSLEVPWRSWEETTTSDVEDLTERVQQREGHNIEIWEDEDKGHYQRDHPACDRAT